MAACERDRGFRQLYFNDPVLRRIPYYALTHRTVTEVLSFNCGLSVAKYRDQLSAIKNNNIRIGPKKPCPGFPRGIESIEKVLNFKIGFQDLEKVLNLAQLAEELCRC